MIQPDMGSIVEPGIYIREQKLGIRLENNILTTRDNPIDLFAHIPVEADAVEEMMSRNRTFS